MLSEDGGFHVNPFTSGESYACTVSKLPLYLLRHALTMEAFRYHIGTLEVKEGVAPKEEAEEVMEPVFLNKTKWKKAKLVEIENLSHDSRLYRFALQSDTQLLGLVCVFSEVQSDLTLIANITICSLPVSMSLCA